MLHLILPALMPVFADGVRGLFSKLTGGAGGNPQNVAERIQLMQAENDRIKALAEIDKPSGEVSQWVANIRGIFRYAIVTLIIIVTAAAVVAKVDGAIVAALLDLSGASMSFIIGERMYLGLKR